MQNPAYIAIDYEGYVTLYWGDGTEQHKEAILRGPRVSSNREFIEVIEEIKAWAEENGYTVIVPAYDFDEPDVVDIDIPDEEASQITVDDVDDLIDDLYSAGDDEAYGDLDDDVR